MSIPVVVVDFKCDDFFIGGGVGAGVGAGGFDDVGLDCAGGFDDEDAGFDFDFGCTFAFFIISSSKSSSSFVIGLAYGLAFGFAL